jgi:hypothetical protein
MFITCHHTEFKTTTFNSRTECYDTHTVFIYKSESYYSTFSNTKLDSANVSPDS